MRIRTDDNGKKRAKGVLGARLINEWFIWVAANYAHNSLVLHDITAKKPSLPID